MEGTLHSKVSVSGKQRRRSIAKPARRFPAKDTQQKIPLPTPCTLAKKPRHVVLFRTFLIGTVFFILLSTFALWRKREHSWMALTARTHSLKVPRSSDQPPNSADFLGKSNSGHHEVVKDEHPEEQNHLSKLKYGTSTHSAESLRGEERAAQSATRHLEDLPTLPSRDSSALMAKTMDHSAVSSIETKKTVHSALSSVGTKTPEHSAIQSANSDIKKKDHHVRTESANTEIMNKDHSYEEPVDQIEWYTREDFKEGQRPLCRISKPIVLSNGTILVPDWMRVKEELLQKCGLRLYGFYSSSETPGVQSIVDIDADFALTIHLEKAQEPTHVPSVFLTEHVLKSSYLFDTFIGYTRPEEGVPETHCISTESDTNCELPPQNNVLKPGIFVPRKFDNSAESSWPRMFVNMLEVAYGNGNEIELLNVSSIVIKSHAGLSENLLGTRFRSIMTADGMFRHLPFTAFDHSSYFSEKNGIVRRRRERGNGGECSITVGISASHDTDTVSGFQASSGLKLKLETLSRFAPLSVAVKEIQAYPATDFEDHKMQMQDLDVFVAGSGDDLSSVGFLPSGSIVFELMPFGISPGTHRSLARALKVGHHIIRGKPQDESFKQCIADEIFNLRKKGKLQFGDNPEWQEPLMKAWEKAVAEFIMSGDSKFDILVSDELVKNYYSKNCALKQKIELDMEDAAREIMVTSKEMCTQT